MRRTVELAGIQNIYISHPNELADVFTRCGPLGSVHAVLNATAKRHRHIVVVSADMPGLTATVLSRLAAAPDAKALVCYEAYMMPLRLRVQAKWLRLATRTLKAGDDVALGSFLDQIPVLRLETVPSEAKCFVNLNSPQDWRDFSGTPVNQI